MRTTERQNALIYIASTGLQRAGLLLALPILLRSLTVPEYGAFGLLQSAITLLPPLLALNLPASATRLYFDGETSEDRVARGSVLVGLVALVLLVATPILAVVSILARRALSALLLLPPSQALELAVVALLGAAGGALQQAGRGILRAQNRALPAAAVNIASSIGFLVTLGAIRLLGSLQLVETIYAYAGTALVTGLAATALVYRRHTASPRSYPPVLASGLSYGLPMLPYVVGLWIMAAGGRWIARAHLGMTDVGIFTLGSQLAMMIGLLGRAAYESWTPVVFAMVAQGNLDSAHSYLVRRGRITVAATTGVALVTIALASTLIPRLAPAYAPVVPLFLVMAAAPVLDVAHLRPHTMLMGLKRTGLIGAYTVFTIVVFAAAGLLGARYFGIWGLTAAYVGAYVLQYLSASTAAAISYRQACLHLGKDSNAAAQLPQQRYEAADDLIHPHDLQ